MYHGDILIEWKIVMPIVRGANHPIMMPLHIVNDISFSANSLAVIAFILANESSTIGVLDVQKRFGFGCRAWARVSKEMREKGLLSVQKGNGGTQLIFQMDWAIS